MRPRRGKRHRQPQLQRTRSGLIFFVVPKIERSSPDRTKYLDSSRLRIAVLYASSQSLKGVIGPQTEVRMTHEIGRKLRPALTASLRFGRDSRMWFCDEQSVVSPLIS